MRGFYALTLKTPCPRRWEPETRQVSQSDNASGNPSEGYIQPRASIPASALHFSLRVDYIGAQMADYPTYYFRILLSHILMLSGVNMM